MSNCLKKKNENLYVMIIIYIVALLKNYNLSWQEHSKFIFAFI